MMNYHVLTLFPEMILEGLNTSIIGRAIEKGAVSLEAINIRDYADNKHNKVDDYPYGGGAGMVMQAEPVYRAVSALKEKVGGQARVIYVTPQGSVFNQAKAKELSHEEDLIFLCGHYEGIDERALEEVVTDYISIGDYVLTGGELPAMVMIDAISRLVPGVLSNEASAEFETFHEGLLEYPQYSRPEEWRGKKTPAILLSGDHAAIESWRKEHSILRTKKRRPDLYKQFLKRQEEEKPRPKKKKLGCVIFHMPGHFADLRDTDMDDIREMLSLAKERGLKLGMIGDLETHSIDQFFDFLVEEERGEDGKISSKAHLAALKKGGGSRKTTLVFEDSEEGLRGAKEAGLRAVYLPYGQRGKEKETAPYYKKISDWVEGMALIRSMS